MKTPDSKIRNILAVVTYTLLIVWLIYSQHKVPANPPAVVKQTVAIP